MFLWLEGSSQLRVLLGCLSDQTERFFFLKPPFPPCLCERSRFQTPRKVGHPPTLPFVSASPDLMIAVCSDVLARSGASFPCFRPPHFLRLSLLTSLSNLFLSSGLPPFAGRSRSVIKCLRSSGPDLLTGRFFRQGAFPFSLPPSGEP